MKFYKTILLGAIISALVNVSGCNSGSDDADVVLEEYYYTDLHNWNDSRGLAQSFLGRGINMGNYFESPTYEGEWNDDLTIRASDFANIRSQGFASVRIPVRWSAHTEKNDPHTIEASFIARVQEVIDQALQQDLKVIINTHHFDELFYNTSEFSLHRQRLLSFWAQLSQQFPLSDYSEEQLVFEFLNEPHENVGFDEWNSLIDDLTKLVWVDNANTQNNALGQRKVMIGTADWGGPSKLPYLDLPARVNADNTLITVHFYDPFEFTHQGASWVEAASQWIGTRWLGTEEEQQTLFDYLDKVAEWNQQPGRNFEVNIGEFGVYSEYSRAEDRRAWTAFIAREAEKRGFSWHYWEYSSMFGAYDPFAEKWRAPLLEGLIPTPVE
ncbi:cellulase family glycosylhydrolase [Vibrio parahaemolyticus]|nr:cellulase family glycosylhydrolase [Vibrio parahaemolyticus]